MNKHYRKTDIILLTPNSFQYYLSDKKNILRSDFNTQVVDDMEIINRDEFNLQIKKFIETNKISPVNLIIILSDNLAFKKELTETITEKKDQEIKDFLDKVPFNNTTYKSDTSGNKEMLYAVNKDFYMSLIDVFEKKGFIIQGLYFAVNIFGASASTILNITSDVISVIIKKIESIKNENFWRNHTDDSLIQGKATNNNKTNLNRQTLLIGIFIFLIFVLAALLIFNSKQQTPKKKAAVQNNIQPAQIAAIPTLAQEEVIIASESPNLESSKSAEINKDVKIQIIYPKESIKKALIKQDFKKVTTSSQTNLTNQKSTIYLSPIINEITKKIILDEIGQSIVDFSIEEINDPNYEAIIVIGI